MSAPCIQGHVRLLTADPTCIDSKIDELNTFESTAPPTVFGVNIATPTEAAAATRGIFAGMPVRHFSLSSLEVRLEIGIRYQPVQAVGFLVLSDLRVAVTPKDETE